MTTENALALANELYFDQKYKEAIPLLQLVVGSPKATPLDHWHLAVALFLSEENSSLQNCWDDKLSLNEVITLLELESLRQEVNLQFDFALRLRKEIDRYQTQDLSGYLAKLDISLKAGNHRPQIEELLTKSIALLKESINIESTKVYRLNDIWDQLVTRDLDSKLSKIFLDKFIYYLNTYLENIPDSAYYQCVLGDLYMRSQEFNLARESYILASEIDHFYPEAYLALANLFFQEKNYIQAEEYYNLCLELEGFPIKALVNYGCLASVTCNTSKTLDLLETSANLLAQLSLDSVNRAKELTLRTQYAEAITCYEYAVIHIPVYVSTWFNLGVYWDKEEEKQTAIECFEKALQAKPYDYNVLSAISSFLLSHDQFSQLNQVLDKVISIYRLTWEVYDSKHTALQRLERIPEAIELTNLFLKNAHGNEKLRSQLNLLNSMAYMGKAEEALLAWNHLKVEINQNVNYFSELDWYNLYIKQIFTLHCIQDDIEKNSEASRFISAGLIQNILQPQVSNLITFPKQRKAFTKSHLKLGFVSPHFRSHSVGILSLDVIHELSLLASQTCLYPVASIKKQDKIFQAFSSLSTINISSPISSFSRLVNQITKDEIDILIDLDSLTGVLSPALLYYRPASVCVSWLGWDAPFISSQNYFITDWQVSPEGWEKHYEEQLVRMPNCLWSVAQLPAENIDPAILKREYGISPEKIVYLSVAPTRKMNRQTLRSQISILRRVPNSILIRKAMGGGIPFLEEECDKQDVSLDRVIFVPFDSPVERHRNIYTIADVLLDSYPCNGGNLNMEALWQELPIVTKVGEIFFSRLGYSFLKNLGIEEGISYSWEEYIDWGVRLGLDHDLRNSVREKLHRAKQPETLSPLWNPKQFAQDMYNIFQELYQNACDNRT